ncbi:hypothetical protein DFH07DRAFT_771353 [Mycena maculata]|uniref:Uncharacterized protein n=1 Tax=Mycena maculata TaxID=230809 RepID=A0AAD7JE19_9AGAR|nr:hypothetical protein DFH07DRAFT_771353 [Mycena maculata]
MCVDEKLGSSKGLCVRERQRAEPTCLPLRLARKLANLSSQQGYQTYRAAQNLPSWHSLEYGDQGRLEANAEDILLTHGRRMIRTYKMVKKLLTLILAASINLLLPLSPLVVNAQQGGGCGAAKAGTGLRAANTAKGRAWGSKSENVGQQEQGHRAARAAALSGEQEESGRGGQGLGQWARQRAGSALRWGTAALARSTVAVPSRERGSGVARREGMKSMRDKHRDTRDEEKKRLKGCGKERGRKILRKTCDVEEKRLKLGGSRALNAHHCLLVIQPVVAPTLQRSSEINPMIPRWVQSKGAARKAP